MSWIVTVRGMLGSARVPSVYLATPVICMNYMKRWDTLLFISLRCKGETEKPNCTLMEFWQNNLNSASPYEIYSHTFSHISRPSRSTTWISSRAFSHEKKKSDNWTPSTDEGHKMCLNAADESQYVRHEFWGRRSRMDLEPRCCTYAQILVKGSSATFNKALWVKETELNPFSQHSSTHFSPYSIVKILYVKKDLHWRMDISRGPQHLWCVRTRCHGPPQRGCRVACQLQVHWENTPPLPFCLYRSESNNRTQTEKSRFCKNLLF